MKEEQQKLKVWKESIRKYNSNYGVLIADVPICKEEDEDER